MEMEVRSRDDAEMPRQPRQLLPRHCYHVTVRCNNREFRLTRFECRQVLLYAITQCQKKYGFKPIKKAKSKRHSPGQMQLWEEWQLPLDEIQQISKQFVLANCLNPEIAELQFWDVRDEVKEHPT